MAEQSTGRILLVRHGETEWNREGRIQGWAPSTLTDRGHRQARALGRAIVERYDVDRVVASDLDRTRETAALLGEAGIPTATFDPAWRERDFGVYQGFEKRALFERHPEFAADNGVVAARARPEKGERLLDLYRRVGRGFDELCETVGEETVLVVTHGGPIYVVLGRVKGMDLLASVTDHAQDNCALNELRVGEELEIVRENETVTR